MKIISSICEMRQYSVAAKRAGKLIGVAPTMGFLHEGHLALLDLAKKTADLAIVTIFVNPTQFGPGEDLDAYPRDFERDCRLCRERGADVVFAPSPDEMYFSDRSAWVFEETLSRPLCGKSRPLHFRGVATVVAKLFNITLPDVAVFGQKDAQQVLIIKRMARDLNFAVKIETAPIVREPDGLAMSSRNRYLSADERQRALSISSSLAAAEKMLKKNGLSALEQALGMIRENIRKADGEIDYVEAHDGDTLQAATENSKSLLLAVAAKFGPARLIDNILIAFA